MKKTMTVLLAAVLLFMISCGKDDGPAVVSSESAISDPSSASSDTEPGTSSAITEPGSDIPSSEEADPALMILASEKLVKGPSFLLPASARSI